MSGQRLGYYNNPEDYDLEPHAEQAVTVGVVNLGVGYQQTLESIPTIRQARTADVTISEASTASPLASGIIRRHFHNVINYIILSPSARGNTVLCSVGADIEFKLIGSTYYPLADFVQANGSTIYRLPAERNLSVQFAIVPPAGFAAPYTDALRYVVGYIPDATDKVLVHPNE